MSGVFFEETKVSAKTMTPDTFVFPMDVVGHPTKGQHDPAAALGFVLKSFCKPFVVTGIMKQLPASVSTGDDVIVGPRKLDAGRSRHKVGASSNW